MKNKRHSLLKKGFIYLCLAALDLHCCTRAFSSCGEHGLLSLWCERFLWWLFLWQSTGSRHTGFSSCGALARQLWHMDLAAIPGPGIDVRLLHWKWIFNHWTTRGAPLSLLLLLSLRKSKGFRESVSGKGTKTTYIFLNITTSQAAIENILARE